MPVRVEEMHQNKKLKIGSDSIRTELLVLYFLDNAARESSFGSRGFLALFPPLQLPRPYNIPKACIYVSRIVSASCRSWGSCLRNRTIVRSALTS
jgi:hypothetical protein